MRLHDLINQVNEQFPDGVDRVEELASYLEKSGYHPAGNGNGRYVLEGDEVHVELTQTHLLRTQSPEAVRMVAITRGNEHFEADYETFSRPPVAREIPSEWPVGVGGNFDN